MVFLKALWNRRTLWALHLAANTVLLSLTWLWLSLPEASAWQLALSACLALVVVLGMLWFHGMTLAAFRLPYGAPPFAGTLQRVPALLLWTALLYGAMIAALRYVPAAKTVWLPRAAAVAVAVLLLPLASQVAGEGFRGFLRAAAYRPLGAWQYYAAIVVLAAVGIWAPYRLIWWIPSVNGLTAQAGSMGVRFLAAYILAVTAWFTMTAVVSRLSARHGG